VPGLFFTDLWSMNYPSRILILFMAGLMVAYGSRAQQQKAADPHTLQAVFRSSLGNVLSDQQLPPSMMKALLDSTLVARDSAGHPYPVVAFNFGYATTDTYTNDTTGRPASSRNYLSFHFKGNRLDSVWRKGIAEKIKPGDILYFDRIVARGPQNHQYLSSPLRFTVE